MLPIEIFDSRKSKTRDPKRKFAAKVYLMEIERNTRITDLKTQKIMDLERAVDKFGIIDIQLLDFAGSIFLNITDWEVQPGFNRLFATNEMSNENLLLEHKLKLSRYLHSFKHQEAMMEFDQILGFGETTDNIFTQFRYICLKGRILMRWRKLGESKLQFEKAFSLLETNFSNNDRVKLINERLNRINPVFENSNWDDYLVEYDEIYLSYLLGLTNYLLKNVPYTEIQNELERSQAIATKYNSIYDLVIIYHLKSELYSKLGEFETAEKCIRTAMDIMKNNHLIQTQIERYSDLFLSMVDILCLKFDFENAQEEIKGFRQLIDLKLSDIGFRNYYSAIIKLSSNVETIENSFNILGLFVDESKEFLIKQRGFEPLIIVKYVFQYIIQGIYLNKFKSRDEVEDLISIIAEVATATPVADVYYQLILIKFSLLENQNLLHFKNKYEKTIFEYDKLLNNAYEGASSYLLILTHYIDFLIGQTENMDTASIALIKLLETHREEVFKTQYIVLSIKFEIIRLLLVNKQQSLLTWMDDINEMYISTTISLMIESTKEKIVNTFDINRILSELLIEDIYQARFEKIIELSISEKLITND